MKSQKSILFIVISAIIFILILFFVKILFTNFPVWVIPIITAVFIFVLGKIFNREKQDHTHLTKGDYNPTEYIARREEDTIFEILNKKNKRIIHIGGCSGIGKTLFMYKILNEINLNKKVANFYALYFYIDFSSSPKEAICSQLRIPEDSSIVSIVKSLKELSKHKKILLLIDNFQENQTFVDEFALKLKNEDICIYFILSSKSYDKKSLDTIKLDKFNKTDISNLAKKIDAQLEHKQIEKIENVSYGLPVFVYFLIKEVANSTLEMDLSNSNCIQDYIIAKVQKLDELTQKCLLLIAFHGYFECKLNKKIVLKLFEEITDKRLISLAEHSFISYNNDYIEIDSSIAQIIRDYYYELRFEYFNTFYRIYLMSCDHKKYIFSLLLTQNKEDVEKISSELEQLLKNKEYFYLINLFDKTFESLNPLFQRNRTFMIWYNYIYLSSLLEIGEYIKAKKYIESDNFKDDSYVNLDDDIVFKTEYLICDLYHLTCEYKNAINNIFILEKKYNEPNYQFTIKWLKAHIKRHQGSLVEALDIFEDILNHKEEIRNEKIVVKSMYAIISIQNFYDCKSFNFKEKFEEINYYLNGKTDYDTSINRHKSIYYKRITKEYGKALALLKSTIVELETKPERILYDYYFEIAEIFRVMSKVVSDSNYKKAEENYLKAIDFSKAIHDDNLFENSQLGLLLLKMKNIDFSEAYFAEELKKLAMLFKEERYINYINFHFIKSFYYKDYGEMLEFFKKNQWYYHLSFLKNHKDITDFELTVM